MIENNFLARITAPELGSATFATDLREVFSNIDDNFKKIVSAPYLEGQEGNSVEAYDMPIVEDGELTEFGAAMVREILGDPDITSIADIDSDSRYDSVGQAQHKIYDYLLSNPTMKVLRTIDPDIGDVDKWICSAEYYCFIDLRVEDLGNCGYPSTQTTFIDYSCLVFAEWNGEQWVFTKGNMMPTLYYSADQGCFCWKVNGMETGIRAQGVKGDDGRPPKAAVVKGMGSSSSIGGGIVNIVVTNYTVFETHVNADNEVIVEASWGNIQDSGLLDGDLVVCIFTISDPTYPGTSYPDMIIANIKKNGEGENTTYSITAPDSNRFSSLWRSYIMFYGFRDIDYKSTDMSKTKAVFVPAFNTGVAHAMFQDDSGVTYTNSGGIWDSEDNLQEDNLVFKRVSERRLIGNQSVGTVNLMTGDDPSITGDAKVKFLGYDMEVEGTSKAMVSGSNGILLGVPVGSVVSWINMDRIPEGWYITGEVTGYVPPVFGMAEVDIDVSDSDVDVVVVNPNEGEPTILKKLVITGIGEYNEIGQRDRRFIPIFCQMTGYEPGSPIVIDTDKTDFRTFVEEDKFNWTMFDIESVSNQEDQEITGIKFYLTKQVN